MPREDIFVAALFVIIFGYFVVAVRGYPPEARVIPLVVAVPGLMLALHNLYQSINKKAEAKRARFQLEAAMFGWILLLVILVWVFGFLITLPLFLVAYLRIRSKEGWRITIVETGVILLAVYFLFYRLLDIPLHNGLLINLWERFSGV